MPQKCIRLPAVFPTSFCCILLYIYAHTVYPKRKYFYFVWFSVLPLRILLFCSLWVPPIFLSLPLSLPHSTLFFTLEHLPRPRLCFPSFHPSVSSFLPPPFCHIPFSSLLLSFFHPVFIAVSASVQWRKIVWGFLLSGRQQQIVWCFTLSLQ